jgi:hypothetical protein
VRHEDDADVAAGTHAVDRDADDAEARVPLRGLLDRDHVHVAGNEPRMLLPVEDRLARAGTLVVEVVEDDARPSGHLVAGICDDRAERLGDAPEGDDVRPPVADLHQDLLLPGNDCPGADEPNVRAPEPPPGELAMSVHVEVRHRVDQAGAHVCRALGHERGGI